MLFAGVVISTFGRNSLENLNQQDIGFHPYRIRSRTSPGANITYNMVGMAELRIRGYEVQLPNKAACRGRRIASKEMVLYEAVDA